MKTYNSPMLQVVSISKKDIIATSETMTIYGTTTSTQLSAGRRFDSWYEGY